MIMNKYKDDKEKDKDKVCTWRKWVGRRGRVMKI